jgi:NAD-dependent deacetylase
MSVYKSIVVLTGAGVSAESGVRTFRDGDGLWEKYRIEEVATPEAFARDPGLVHRFYNERRAQLTSGTIRPNPGHLAIARLEREYSGRFLLVTQNVDNLHEEAGSKNIRHMHGELTKVRCTSCGYVCDWRLPLGMEHACSKCSRSGSLRPHIVWFGEMPFYMDEITAALETCDLFLSVGTSGLVYPAAMFVRRAGGARKIEVNMTETGNSDAFDEHVTGPSGTTLPALVDEILGQPGR